MSDAADADQASEKPTAPSEPVPSPKRGAFPTPRSVIEQAEEFVPEDPEQREPDQTSSDTDPDR